MFSGFSSIFASSSEAFASELLANIEEMFPRYLYYRVCHAQITLEFLLRKSPASKELTSKKIIL